jgi:uncharacterized protein YsxB (DUF464 family)
MVDAKIRKSSGNIVSVILSGHAESSDEGYDMVCSAVSAVSLTITNGLTEILKVKPNISMEDGFLSLYLESLSEEDIDKSQVLLQTMLLGLKSIEFNYGEYISVEIEEV